MGKHRFYLRLYLIFFCNIYINVCAKGGTRLKRSTHRKNRAVSYTAGHGKETGVLGHKTGPHP